MIPDIVGSSRIKDFVNQYGPEGAFIPLNDLIEEHAPNIKAYLDERPEIARPDQGCRRQDVLHPLSAGRQIWPGILDPHGLARQAGPGSAADGR